MNHRALRLALLLHPAAYRREMGAELASVFEDTTAGAGRWATGRELLDLAAHGLRLRLGLGSAGLLARAAGLAAPFAAGAAASGLAIAPSLWWWNPPFDLTVPIWLDLISALIEAATLLAVVSGRWTATRLLAPFCLLAPLATVVHAAAYGHSQSVVQLVHAAVILGPRAGWVAILLTAPRDLLGPPNRRSSLIAAAGLLVGGLLLLMSTGNGPTLAVERALATPAAALALLTPALILTVATLPGLLRGRPGPAAVALAVLPLCALAVSLTSLYLWHYVSFMAFLPPAVAATVAVALGLAGRRRPQPTRH